MTTQSSDGSLDSPVSKRDSANGATSSPLHRPGHQKLVGTPPSQVLVGGLAISFWQTPSI